MPKATAITPLVTYHAVTNFIQADVRQLWDQNSSISVVAQLNLYSPRCFPRIACPQQRKAQCTGTPRMISGVVGSMLATMSTIQSSPGALAYGELGDLAGSGEAQSSHSSRI